MGVNFRGRLRKGARLEGSTSKNQKALGNTRGFTLIELLCASAITVMIAGMLLTLTGLMANTVESIVAHSNAKVLCSTLSTAAQDELRYATNLEYDSQNKILWFKSGAIGFGTRCHLAAVDDNDNYASRGYLALYTGTGAETSGKDYQRKLIEKATYTNGLTASIEVKWLSDVYQAQKTYKFETTVSVYDNTGTLRDSRTFYTVKNERDIKSVAI